MVAELVYRKIGDYHKDKYVLREKWLVCFDDIVYYYDSIEEAQKHINLINQLKDKKKSKLNLFSMLEEEDI